MVVFFLQLSDFVKPPCLDDSIFNNMMCCLCGGLFRNKFAIVSTISTRGPSLLLAKVLPNER